MWLALLLLATSFLWHLAHGIITSFYNLIAYVLFSFTLFPNYILDSLNDGLINWYQFFAFELPLYFTATWRAVVWFKRIIGDSLENIINILDDSHSYVSLTVPSAFHDTFGDILGDLTNNDWRTMRHTLYVLFIATLAFYIMGFIILSVDDGPTNDGLPTPTATDGRRIRTKVDLQVRVTQLPSTTTPLRRHDHSRPLVLENFKPTPNFFNGFYPNGCARSRLPNTRMSSVQGESFNRNVIEVSGDPQLLPTPDTQSPSCYEANPLSHSAMDLVVSPLELLPPSQLVCPYVDALAAIPAVLWPLASFQGKETINAQPPSLRPSFEMICQGLAARSGELKVNLDMFIERTNRFEHNHQERQQLVNLIDTAFTALKQHKDSLSTSEADLLHWADHLCQFWSIIQPNGYTLISHYGQDMANFLFGIITFGQFLSLQLLDLDMTAPPLPVEEVLPIYIKEVPNVALPNTETTALPPLASSIRECQATEVLHHILQMPGWKDFDVGEPPVTTTHDNPAPIVCSQNGPISTAAQVALPVTSECVPKFPNSTLEQPPNPIGHPPPLKFEFSQYIPTATLSTALFTTHTHERRTFSQQSVTSKNIEDVQPLSRPFSRSPLTTLDVSNSTPESVTQNKKASFFDNIGFWSGKGSEDQAKLDMKFFGWDKVDGQATAKLFNFSAAVDFRFTGTDAQPQDRQFVEAELDKRAAAFKRSIYVLRMQANIDKHDVSLPPLLGDVIHFLEGASRLTRACGITPDTYPDCNWFRACVDFHNEIYTEPPIYRGLRYHYGKEKCATLKALWENSHTLWLGNDE
jgi:hypothetical protein